MLIDDEKLIVEGLRKVVKWADFGCEVVPTAGDAAEGAALIRAAYEGGINYFDTANAYTDSEEKIGLALADVRDRIVISTKSAARDKKTVLEHIELSLRRMKTDYIDLFQFHQVPAVPDPNDPEGAYAGALEADYYGRAVPKNAHGSENLGRQSSSTKLVLEATMRLFVSRFLPGWQFAGSDTAGTQDLYFLWDPRKAAFE